MSKSITAKEMHAELSKIIESGRGNSPVNIMKVVDGFTFACDVMMIIPSQPYDGDRVWIISKELS